jgi:DnaK suppressor protein
MNEYKQVRDSLIEMLEDLNDRLVKISHDCKESPDWNFEEQAGQVENDEVFDDLGNAARTEIAMVKQAIARIDKGQYGLCQACQQPISKERLKAAPYAILCIDCISQAER